LGRALETDVLEYRITVTEIGLQIRELAESLEKQKRSLAALVGLPPGTSVDLAEGDGDAQAGVTPTPMGEFFEHLWPIVRNASVDLEKQNIIFRYQKIQAAQSRRFYLPSVTVEGGMNFTGARYPLTEPAWTLKCHIAFDNSFLPLTASGGLTARNKELQGSSASAGTSLPGNITWGLEQGRAQLALRAGDLGLKDAELALYEGTLDAVQGHDNAITTLEMQRSLVALAERRLKVDEYNLRRGDLKRTDFLEALCELAEKKTAAVETEYRILTFERALEIAANVPFGQLAENFAENVKGDIL
jgi:outer membrane protein TolC